MVIQINPDRKFNEAYRCDTLIRSDYLGLATYNRDGSDSSNTDPALFKMLSLRYGRFVGNLLGT